MRILIVSQYFWPENFRINDLAKKLAQRGHAVTVLTGEPNYPEGQIFPEYRADRATFRRFGAVRVFRVPIIPRGKSNMQLALNYLSFAFSAAVFGIWKLRGRRYDAIFVFQTSPITAALPAIVLRRLKRAPLLMWVLDVWPDTLSAIGIVKSPRLLALITRVVVFVYKRCDRILIQSRAFAPKVAKLAGGDHNIRYFPGWAESVFEDGNVDPAPELDPYARDFKVLFAGNIGDAQDFPSILAAADSLRDVPGLRWIIVGDGRAAPFVRDEVDRRGLQDKVILLGRFPIERMPSFFVGANALLVSLRASPIWGMTIPGKVQSYLVSGKPLIAMLDGEGAKVIEEAGAGLVVGAGDSDALAERIRLLLSMPMEFGEAMGQAGKAYGEREFNSERLIDALEDWMGECAEIPHCSGGRSAK
jgi:glycosyltransferase involved in cell wall biosynthesis